MRQPISVVVAAVLVSGVWSGVSAGAPVGSLADPEGSIAAWGWKDWGQTDVPSPNEGFTAVSAGGLHNLALKTDESITAWGDNRNGQCNVPSPNAGFTAVAGEGITTWG